MIERFLRVASAVSRVDRAAPQAAPSPLGKGTGCVLHSSVTLQPVILFYLILCYFILVQTLKTIVMWVPDVYIDHHTRDKY